MSGQLARDDEGPAHYLQSRVRSFPSDPLHSAAYFRDLLSYLTAKSDKTATARYQIPNLSKIENNFLYAYPITSSSQRQATIYTNASKFSLASSTPGSELIFLTGSPSAEWLDAIKTRLGVDLRFVQSHMDFLPNSHREWYTNSGLPSRNQHSFRLLVPSIIFIGPEGRNLAASDLHEARIAVSTQLQRRFKSLFAGPLARHGESVVRQVNIHTGDAIVMEQAVTVSVVRQHSGLKILVWSDAGQDENVVPVPKTASFKNVSDTVEFCPVFFEKELFERPAILPTIGNSSSTQATSQPLSVLPSRYGETVDWAACTEDPLMVLQELFRFQSAATGQYLNMLRKLTTSTIARTHPTGDAAPVMEDILHFEYTKTVLMQWLTHLRTLAQNLEFCFPDLDLTMSQTRNRRATMVSELRRDLDFLLQEADTLINLCESGKSTIMSSFSVFQSKRSAEESRLVTQLTKATNRITFIFLPISFVTSVFGMNFKQFGQGPLSITIWAAVTLPLLALCILMNEYGNYVARLCYRVWAGCTKHK